MKADIKRIDLEQVVDTAAEVFASHGFTGIGMRELSERCGVNVPTLYYYFGSKEKLFEEVCRAKYRKAFQQIQDAVDPAVELERPEELLCGGLFDILIRDRTLFLLLRRDLIHGSVSGAAFTSFQQYHGLIDLFARLFEKRFGEPAARQLAFTATALIFGYCEFVHVGRPEEQGGTEAFIASHRERLIGALRALLRGIVTDGPQSSAPSRNPVLR